ncbi:MAG: cytochrome c/FTR1 family iron permease [Immundisolibacter sp.]
MPRVLGLLACLLLTLPSASASAQDDTAGRLVHLLDYISVDYGAAVADGEVISPSEYAEMQEFTTRVAQLTGQLPARDGREALIDAAASLRAAVQARAPAQEVAQRAADLKQRIGRLYELRLAPARPPDLAAAARLYQAHCASCHGAEGHGDGPAAHGLEPPPSDFHDAERQDSQSLAMLYNTISYGVAGTGMAGFSHLPAPQRWALAFYVGSLRYSAATRAAGEQAWADGCCRQRFGDIAAVTGAVPQQLAGPEQRAVLAYLRSAPQALDGSGSEQLALTRRLLQQSLTSYRSGQREAAYGQALAAYLDGFEPLEQVLQAVDPALKREVESRMMAFRQALRGADAAPDVEPLYTRLQASLERVERALGSGDLDASLAFASAFFIVLREGLEAVLVLAAMFAFLGKAGRREAYRYLHAGWAGALVAGVGTWALAAYVVTISGATRELSEGVAALLAAGILCYMGFWLHDKAHADRWQAYISQHLGSAMGGGSLWLLALLAFIAVYREVFETILFFQALWLQTSAAGQRLVLAGAIGGAAALVLASWVLMRLSARLPLGLFFGASALLMYVLAVVFAGKGIVALQEAGTLPASTVNFPRVDLLGVYPTLQGLGAQALLVLAALAHYGLSRRQRPATRDGD